MKAIHGSAQFILRDKLVRTAHPTAAMIPIIAKKATTQMMATAFSCSGLGRVMPIASMIPLVNETKYLMNIWDG